MYCNSTHLYVYYYRLSLCISINDVYFCLCNYMYVIMCKYYEYLQLGKSPIKSLVCIQNRDKSLLNILKKINILPK